MSRILVSVAALFLLLGVLSACDPDGGSNTLAISSFEANPGTITAAGQAVTLSWDVNGPATSLDIDMGVGAVSGTSVVVNPTATTSYTLTASNSSGSVTAMTTVTVGNGGGDGEAPKGTFGVALSPTGPFQSDEGGGITSPSDPRTLQVKANSTFYASAVYSDPSGISSLTLYLANSQPPGFRGDLIPGQAVNGFIVSAPSGCTLDGTQTSVTCNYEIAVGNIPNISAFPDAGGEFAYVLKVRSADPEGNTNENSRRGYVVVGGGATVPGNNDPVAAFSATPASSSSGATYDFSAAGSTDPDGDTLSYAWNFGDGTTSTSRDFTKTYTAAGSYTVTLTVSDGNGGSDKATKVVTAEVPGGNQAPVASFVYSPATIVVSTTIVTFDPSASSDADGTVASYAWTVTSPSGSTADYSSNPLPLRFSQVGDYTVSLVVTDDAGAVSAPFPQTVAVQQAGDTFSVVIDTPSDGVIGTAGTATLPLTATTSSAPAGTTFKWSAAGNNPGTVTFASDSAEDTSATFSAAGTYTLTLTASGGAATASDDVLVKINPADTTPPSVTIDQASGQIDPTNASPINFTATFSESVIGFTLEDVTFRGAGATTATVTGGPSSYTIALSGMTTDGAVTASVAADAAGNVNMASTSTDNSVTFDVP